MKFFTTAISVLTLIQCVNGVVVAEVSPDVKICGQISDMGRNVMAARQDGVQMQDVVEALIASFPDSERLTVVLAVVNAAYMIRMYDAPEHKTIVVDAFADGVYLECIKSHGSGQYIKTNLK
jgi:hypothetical protein